MRYLCKIVRNTPLVLCFLTPLSIFITYGIAVGNGHVSALWPYISDTGTTPPESCIFGLFLSTIAFILCAIVYVRYREVSEYAKLYPSVRISSVCNGTGTVFGFASAVGLHMVACFQETNEFITHIIGALLCFISATIYFTFQTVFTRKMHPEAKYKFWIRAVLTALCVLFIIGTFAPVAKALKEFKGKDKLKWTAEDGGHSYHMISTFSEWLLVFSFCSYICSIYWDFRKLRIEPPKILFIELDNSEDTGGEDQSSKPDGKSLWI